MLMRFDPFRELDQLTQQLVRQSARPSVPMDAWRHGDQFLVEIDLPGVDADSIDLTVENNVLTVSATRHRTFTDGDQVLVAERPEGQFQRQLLLGDQLDAENVRASYDNGVLTLTLSVAEQAKPRKVEIASSGKKELVGSAE